MFVLNLSNLEGRSIKSKFKYTKLNRFPGAAFDCTVDVEPSLPSSSVVHALKKIKSRILKEVSIKDIYLSNGRKFITIHCYFIDPDKTLDGKDIKNLEDKIVTSLEQENYLLKK